MSEALKTLQKIESEWGLLLDDDDKRRIKLLILEFRFLKIDVSFYKNLKNAQVKLDTAKSSMEALVRYAESELSYVYLNQMHQNVNSISRELIDGIWDISHIFPDTYEVRSYVGLGPEVEEFVDDVIRKLSDLAKTGIYYHDLLHTTKKLLEEVVNELMLLRSFVRFVSHTCNDPESQHSFYTHFLTVFFDAAKMTFDGPYTDPLLSDLLLMRIKPVKASVRKIYIDVLLVLKSDIQHLNRIEYEQDTTTGIQAGFLDTLLHNLESLPIDASEGQMMRSLELMLKNLRSHLTHLPIPDLGFHLQDIHSLIVDAGLLIYSSYATEEEEEHDMAPTLVDMPGIIQRMEPQINLVFQKAFQSYLPMIHGLGYVDFLLNNLKEFQHRFSDSLVPIQNQLQRIHNELVCLQPFLKEVAARPHNKHDRIQDCATLLIGKAYEVEFIVDSCISKKAPVSWLVQWLLDVLDEIIHVKAEIQEKKMLEFDSVLHNTEGSDTASHLPATPSMNEEIVGFEDVVGILRVHLLKGAKDQDVIAIVGMAGQGKTTLANKLYFDESVVRQFEVRAQCCASQAFSRKDMLLSMLHGATGNNPTLSKLPDDELAVRLQRHLSRKRVLILVDDMWETSKWDDIKSCFEKAGSGSRIILTTRDHEVANYARYVSDPLHLRMFNDDESWELLRYKVFGEETCSSLLTNVGQKIAKKCGGLPLSIVLVAGILAKMEKEEGCWERVAADLGPHIHADAKPIIEQSYSNLPYHLQPCFLYFGIFLEDKEIKVSNLTWLWIAEGFIKSCEDKSLEDIAEGYLNNLVGRNLVMAAKRSSGGKVKACRIHDLLLDFCKERAEEKKLLCWIKRDHNAEPSSCIYARYQLAQCRMSIYGEEDNLAKWSSSFPVVGSVIFREDKRVYSSIGQASHICHNFKFLKVLDLEFTTIDSFPTELVYLRYFAARTAQESITSSIANLWNLETFIVKSMGGKLSLPITLWEMAKLRHLHIYDNAYFILNGVDELLDVNSSKLDGLETLSSPCFSRAEDVEFMLRKTPYLRKLRCSILDFGHTQYPVLDFLTRLEKLNILFAKGSFITGECNFPSNLKRLTLTKFFMGRSYKSNIAMLANLQVLKLVSISFENKKWEVTDDEFPQLRVLKVVHCGHFEEWNVSGEGFPSLEHLVLRSCRYLLSIPSRFEDISSLKSIEVRSCKESVAKSAMDIRETQVEEMQNCGFKVFIR